VSAVLHLRHTQKPALTTEQVKRNSVMKVRNEKVDKNVRVMEPDCRINISLYPDTNTQSLAVNTEMNFRRQLADLLTN
jgi:hypothetical protein